METVKVVYEGDLRCRARNNFGFDCATDATVEFQGKGEAFSPTDAVALALASCSLTIMAYSMRRHNVDIKGSFVDVSKEMAASPKNMVGKIGLSFKMCSGIPASLRPTLEKAVYACPVHNSLHPDIQYQISFNYPD
ncbi:MAG: OsmC family protein [Candidatus Omnitrophica bacterium]|nr:OsmC family protein [Candidatus Omnitrophota bacterium]